MSDLRYSPDEFDLSDFTTAAATQVGEDEFTTVERLPVDKGEGVYIGQGSSKNPLQAEGSITGDPQTSGSSPTALNGQYRLVVLNSQNNVVDIITQGKISQLRKTRSNSLDGDITPFIDIEVMEPYKVGYQLKLASGSDTYGSSNSSLAIDGFSGEALN